MHLLTNIAIPDGEQLSRISNWVIFRNLEYQITVLTAGLLYSVILSKFSKKIRLKTLLNPEIFPDCYTIFDLFCNSLGVLYILLE